MILEATMRNQKQGRMVRPTGNRVARSSVAVGKKIKMQPWLTLVGAASVTEVLQPSDGWLRGADYPTYHMQVQMKSINGTNATLTLETAPSAEGPWESITTFAAATDTMIVISSEGGDNRFSNLVRWKFTATAAWDICFALNATPGMSVSNVGGTPRKV
jgi:hypothetical protein